MTQLQGHIEGNTVIIDPASLQSVIEEALAKRPKETTPADKPTAHQEEQFLSGWLPRMEEVKEDALGGLAGILAAKAIAKAVGPLSHPVLADLSAYVALRKLNILKGGTMRAAQTVLMVDALRALLPVVDTTINQAVGMVPVILPGAPINLSIFGALPAGTAAMRETPRRVSLLNV